MTVKEFKKRVRYRRGTDGLLHACINCKWGSRNVRPPWSSYGMDGAIILFCGANSGKKFRAHPCGTCDMCVPRRTDAFYPLFPYEVPEVNITVYE